MHGVDRKKMLLGEWIGSFSYLEGRSSISHESLKTIHIIETSQAKIRILGTRKSEYNLEKWLAMPCKEAGRGTREKCIADNIESIFEFMSYIFSERGSFFDLEIGIIDKAQGYAFSTWNRIKSSSPKTLRFVFQVDLDKSKAAAADSDIADIVGVLSHEIIHVKYHDKPGLVKNLVSSEFLAHFLESCIKLFHSNRLESPSIDILPPIEWMEKYQESTASEVTQVLAEQGFSESIIGGVLAQFSIWRTSGITGVSEDDNQRKADLLNHCKSLANSGHDFSQEYLDPLNQERRKHIQSSEDKFKSTHQIELQALPGQE